jgi:hypothetical protein
MRRGRTFSRGSSPRPVPLLRPIPVQGPACRLPGRCRPRRLGVVPDHEQPIRGPFGSSAGCRRLHLRWVAGVEFRPTRQTVYRPRRTVGPICRCADPGRIREGVVGRGITAPAASRSVIPIRLNQARTFRTNCDHVSNPSRSAHNCPTGANPASASASSRGVTSADSRSKTWTTPRWTLPTNVRGS